MWLAVGLVVYVAVLDALNAGRGAPPFVGAVPLQAQFLGLGIGGPGFTEWYRWVLKYALWSASLITIERASGRAFLVLSVLQALMAFSFVMDAGVNSEFQCEHHHYCCSSYAYFYLAGTAVACAYTRWASTPARRAASALAWVVAGLVVLAADGFRWDHHVLALALGSVAGALACVASVASVQQWPVPQSRRLPGLPHNSALESKRPTTLLARWPWAAVPGASAWSRAAWGRSPID
jgi:hypothetical protein